MAVVARALGRTPVAVHFQLVMDCADPDLLARFWAKALAYELAPVPAGFATWNDFYRDLGMPEENLVDGADRISDPKGHGPGIWFHAVSEVKTVKNRLHLDIHASGERTDPIETRRMRVDAEAARLAGLGATTTGALPEGGRRTTTRSGWRTQKATSSISTDRGTARLGRPWVGVGRQTAAWRCAASQKEAETVFTETAWSLDGWSSGLLCRWLILRLFRSRSLTHLVR
jgi:hypothetical protein